MTGAELGQTAPWVILSGVTTWFFQGLAHRRGMRKIATDHLTQVETSRDDLAIELLTSARQEIRVARSQMDSLRQEIKTLRPLEQHFYHFQQALDHLAAILHAREEGTRAVAERNARAFLARMNAHRSRTSTIQGKDS